MTSLCFLTITRKAGIIPNGLWGATWRNGSVQDGAVWINGKQLTDGITQN